MSIKSEKTNLNSRAFNLLYAIEENKDKLQPPVNNMQLWDDSQFIPMLVGGPNKRRDFHISPSDEFFHQIKGNCYVECINEQGEREIVTVGEGEMFMLPAMVPHSPHRTAGSYGIVIEQKREGKPESVVWYCDNCNHELYKKTMEITDIVSQLKAVIEEFNSNEELQTCDKCGHKLPEAEEWK
ncbi:3-hydroxyanthranilate 3,4-dioxygenase [Virgibacillus ihumii]|uniref:3-hydroxyanthranilate 3,4-dioxygenase n=1 Tax=Virgibacillus ihumii TaxID=2686091 RepID=UPI00157CBBAA|nr:3-hydroxyanthranilate 3,4-dioxygenase [Virgibacillus ihumii]